MIRTRFSKRGDAVFAIGDKIVTADMNSPILGAFMFGDTGLERCKAGKGGGGGGGAGRKGKKKGGKKAGGARKKPKAKGGLLARAKKAAKKVAKKVAKKARRK